MLILNSGAVVCAVLVAIFYPNIGSILRYTGALCGAIYVFALPVLVRREALKQKGRYTTVAAIPTWFFITFGVVNVVMQFVTIPQPSSSNNINPSNGNLTPTTAPPQHVVGDSDTFGPWSLI